MKKTIMIDLDGVLDNYEKYTDEIPSIRKGAKEFVEELSNKYELVLFTTRNSNGSNKSRTSSRKSSNKFWNSKLYDKSLVK